MIAPCAGWRVHVRRDYGAACIGPRRIGSRRREAGNGDGSHSCNDGVRVERKTSHAYLLSISAERDRTLGTIACATVNGNYDAEVCCRDRSSVLEIDHDAALNVAGVHAGEDLVDVLELGGRNGGLDLALGSELSASSRSWRVPTIEPRTVRPLSTISKIGAGSRPAAAR